MNYTAIWVIYRAEMQRMRRTLLQSLISPVVSTALYFIVFGAAIGSRMQAGNAVAYGGFITPGLIMLALITQCIANGANGIYFPKFTGTIYEILSAPIALPEVLIGYVGAATTKGMILGLIILATSTLFVDMRIDHPLLMLAFMLLTAISFSIAGFIIGVWAQNFEQLSMVPTLVVPPLTFLGGTFYSISALPHAWQVVSHFNPVFYLVSGFRWSFFGEADINPLISLGMVGLFLAVCLVVIARMFSTGYKLKA
ncbi:ABC transporter permease [Allorhizobium taibaishanense]|uniref:Transport permease protein n=1 Tax=Allorhizobium taibaishanense TaxID=887144 RepID=A0A1Q9A3J5_9HYPH|nr:ABC transporter permease [Allorhizobium taibaishanense]MBB4006056.1 ABC-2 type transport system permease protein [Allorhizobium taibaishanense]OLP49068.1 sugar ABC transporter permease [Allorhizobium taibaishanense]